MSTNNPTTPSDYTWVLDDSLVPEHEHGQYDDAKNKLRDTETGKIVSIPEANVIARERLGTFFDCEFDRRNLLRAGGGLAAGMMMAVASQPRYAFASTPGGNGTILVNIFLRGAADGLSVLAPYNDSYYLSKRTTTKVSMKGATILNNTFALAPELSALTEAWNAGELSFANAVGTKGQGRSHFVEQSNRDRAAPTTVRSGWLGRYLSLSAGTDPMFRAFTHGDLVAPSLFSEKPSLAVDQFSTFTVAGAAGVPHLIQQIYKSGGGELGSHAEKTVQAVSEVHKLKKAGYTPANGAVYDNNADFESDNLGARLEEVAQVIKANKGLEVVCLDVEGWDTHSSQSSDLKPLLTHVAKNLAAFRKDLGPALMKKVIVITQSEFGRTTVENASEGTDHGHGSFVMCMSGKAAQKKVVGDFPKLQPVSGGDRDMRVTTDYRDIMAEILVKGMGATHISQIFPGYTPTYKGILRSSNTASTTKPPATGVNGNASTTTRSR